MKILRRSVSGLWLPVLAMLALGVVVGCVTNEMGRRQLILLSAEEEMQLGFNSFKEMKKEMKASEDPAANEIVQRVGERIRAVVDLPGAEWEFVVFENEEPNAFCLPGGKIGVHTGILAITQNEAGLATVLGHEVAHATLRHGNERISEGLAIQGVGYAAGAAVNVANPKWVGAFSALYAPGAQVVRALPHSRSQESEADHLGLLYMARAGFDPEEAVAFWQRFAAYGKKAGSASVPWFLQTHPVSEKRIQQLKGWMPEAKQAFRAPGR